MPASISIIIVKIPLKKKGQYSCKKIPVPKLNGTAKIRARNVTKKVPARKVNAPNISAGGFHSFFHKKDMPYLLIEG
jgi:hypothetical protein